ncbi:retinoblastoma-related protein 1-like, partial [Trifolium medium]|nr:retinoblastoma-related protein 1-like [Trifolium medium]
SELYTVVTPARSYKIAEFINKADGHLAQCPEPPKIFTFPSLPVMSVEEKSAAHYACVSPIGSSEIIMLGAVRIKSMVEMLGLSQQIRENVYRLFQRILHQHTSLFFDRHIDHIILCCFCAAAKISKLSLTFKEVISSYVNQPQCNPRVFDSVFVDWALACQDSASGKRKGQEHVDFVTFCKDIFLPSVEPLLLELFTEGTSGQKRKKMAQVKIASIKSWLSPSVHPLVS